MTPPQAHKPRSIRAAEAARCLEYQLSGMTIRMIAEKTGLSKSVVQSRLDMALASIVVPAVDEMRKREGERLVHLLSKLQPAVDTGDREAIKLAAQLSASYRKLYGLNAPEQHQLLVRQQDSSDIELIDMINTERAKVQAEEQRLRETA